MSSLAAVKVSVGRVKRSNDVRNASPASFGSSIRRVTSLWHSTAAASSGQGSSDDGGSSFKNPAKARRHRGSDCAPFGNDRQKIMPKMALRAMPMSTPFL